ncbi:hypothetical protein BH10CYA1_BH10CYA1_64250 [soil metagenome]
MAQRKPENQFTVDQLIQLVDKLSPADREELYRRLDLKSWGEKWHALCAKVDAQGKDLPPLSEQQVFADMKEIREELKAERAHGNS